MPERNELLEKAHTLYNLAAPSAREQRAMVKIRHEMEDAGETPRTIFLTIIGAIWDGMQHGNWPTEG